MCCNIKYLTNNKCIITFFSLHSLNSTIWEQACSSKKCFIQLSFTSFAFWPFIWVYSICKFWAMIPKNTWIQQLWYAQINDKQLDCLHNTRRNVLFRNDLRIYSLLHRYSETVSYNAAEFKLNLQMSLITIYLQPTSNRWYTVYNIHPILIYKFNKYQLKIINQFSNLKEYIRSKHNYKIRLSIACYVNNSATIVFKEPFAYGVMWFRLYYLQCCVFINS